MILDQKESGKEYLELNWLPLKIDVASGNEDKIVWSMF